MKYLRQFNLRDKNIRNNEASQFACVGSANEKYPQLSILTSYVFIWQTGDVFGSLKVYKGSKTVRQMKPQLVEIES